MSQIKFGHVFFALMALSFLSAFFISPAITDKGRSQIQNIFVPVSYPARRFGAALHDRFAKAPPRDNGSPNQPRSSDELIAENTRLRVLVDNLSGQVKYLSTLEGERAAFGEIRKFCTPFRVVGGDSGPADSLMITGTSFNGINVNMPVLYQGGIAGKISRVGAGGATVMLVTDRRFAAEVTFRTDRADITERILLNGAGKGLMTARITQKAAQELAIKIDDWAILNDRDWDRALSGYHVGYVESIQPSRDPGFVEIQLRPDQRLSHLTEVMVLNRRP
jgi:cell shape-determining protein MreC